MQSQHIPEPGARFNSAFHSSYFRQGNGAEVLRTPSLNDKPCPASPKTECMSQEIIINADGNNYNKVLQKRLRYCDPHHPVSTSSVAILCNAQ